MADKVVSLSNLAETPLTDSCECESTVEFVEFSQNPCELVDCIHEMDQHVHRAIIALFQTDDPSKALDMVMKEIHAAFDDLPVSWISYCVTELLFRWHREMVEAMRRNTTMSSSENDIKPEV